MQLTALQLFVGEAAIFAPKHQRHLVSRSFWIRLPTRLARAEQRPRNRALARAAADNETAIGNRLIKGLHNHRPVEHIERIRGAEHRLLGG